MPFDFPYSFENDTPAGANLLILDAQAFLAALTGLDESYVRPLSLSDRIVKDEAIDAPHVPDGTLGQDEVADVEQGNLAQNGDGRALIDFDTLDGYHLQGMGVQGVVTRHLTITAGTAIVSGDPNYRNSNYDAFFYEVNEEFKAKEDFDLTEFPVPYFVRVSPSALLAWTHDYGFVGGNPGVASETRNLFWPTARHIGNWFITDKTPTGFRVRARGMFLKELGWIDGDPIWAAWKGPDGVPGAAGDMGNWTNEFDLTVSVKGDRRVA